MTKEVSPDLLAAALAALSSGPVVVTGYRRVTDTFAVNLPRGHQARLSALPGGAGLLIESDLPEWLSLEAALPDNTRSARVCVGIRAERILMADLFLRVVPQGGALTDGSVTRLRLGARAATEAVLPAPEVEGAPRAIILLRAPPTECAVALLRLEQGAAPSCGSTPQSNA